MALLTREMLGDLPEPLPKTTLHAIPDGSAGIAATLDYMVTETKKYRTDLTLRSLAENIIANVAIKNYWAEAEAVQNWVRSNIRYTQDVYDVETIKDPLTLVFSRFGDCDDMALLAGTLLITLGHPVRYVATGASEPGEFDHVYVETKIANRWVGVETTENVPLGWIPEPQIARMVRHV